MIDEPDSPDDGLSIPDFDAMTVDEQTTWAMGVLDRMPPEELRQMLIDRGTLDLVASVLQERAKSDDPEARREAREIIGNYDLGLLLVHEVDDQGLATELGKSD